MLKKVNLPKKVLKAYLFTQKSIQKSKFPKKSNQKRSQKSIFPQKSAKKNHYSKKQLKKLLFIELLKKGEKKVF